MANNYPRWDQATGAVRCCQCKHPIGPGMDIYLKSKGIYYCSACGLDRRHDVGNVLAGGIEEAFMKDVSRLPDEAADHSLSVASRYMARQPGRR